MHSTIRPKFTAGDQTLVLWTPPAVEARLDIVKIHLMAVKQGCIVSIHKETWHAEACSAAEGHGWPNTAEVNAQR